VAPSSSFFSATGFFAGAAAFAGVAAFLASSGEEFSKVFAAAF